MTAGNRRSDPRHGTLTAGERTALLRKYQVLADWRRRKDTGAPTTSTTTSTSPSTAPAALKALAAEFPGALRELDVLGLPELQRRIDRLTAAADGDQGLGDDRWMAWIWGYHGLMRAALAMKGAAGKARTLAPATVSQLGTAAQAPAGIVVDDTFVRAVMRPPGGRLSVVVLRALAACFGVPATEISHTLFPPRRSPRVDHSVAGGILGSS